MVHANSCMRHKPTRLRFTKLNCITQDYTTYLVPSTSYTKANGNIIYFYGIKWDRGLAYTVNMCPKNYWRRFKITNASNNIWYVTINENWIQYFEAKGVSYILEYEFESLEYGDNDDDKIIHDFNNHCIVTIFWILILISKRF